MCGSEPGRGKNTDKLRECILECRLACFAPAGCPSNTSDAERDVCMPGGATTAGKDADSGDGETGENGVDVDRVRAWPFIAKEERSGEATACPFRGRGTNVDRYGAPEVGLSGVDCVRTRDGGAAIRTVGISLSSGTVTSTLGGGEIRMLSLASSLLDFRRCICCVCTDILSTQRCKGRS